MAFTLCPKCHNESFLWSSDDDPYTTTHWHCHVCKYNAIEDERNISICSICKKEAEALLEDEESKYWWCFSCDNIRNSKS